MTDTNLHQEALSLETNEAFVLILAEIDTAARDGLVATQAIDIEQIRDHQAMARAVKAIRERVRLMAVTSAPKKAPGLA